MASWWGRCFAVAQLGGTLGVTIAFSYNKFPKTAWKIRRLWKFMSHPISRVLSFPKKVIIIRLGHKSLYGSSNLPGSNVGHAIRNPIWSCSEWSLPCNRLLLAARCALTAPFHPYQPRLAVFSLLHLSWAHAPQPLAGTLPCGARTFLPLIIFVTGSDYLGWLGAQYTWR